MLQQRRNSASEADGKQAQVERPSLPAADTVEVTLHCDGDAVRLTIKAEDATPRVPNSAAAALLREASLVRRELKAAAAVDMGGGPMPPPVSRFANNQDISRRGSAASDGGKEPSQITARGSGGQGKWTSEAGRMFRQATGAMEDLQREWQAKMSFKGTSGSEGKPGSS